MQDKPEAITRRRFMGGAAISTAAFTIVPGHVLGQGRHQAAQRKTQHCRDRRRWPGCRRHRRGEKARTSWRSATSIGDTPPEPSNAFPKPDSTRTSGGCSTKRRASTQSSSPLPITSMHLRPWPPSRWEKHVYCEKPLTHSVWEARQVAEAARKHQVATQMGNQGQASEERRRLSEFVWDGAIGPVREAHIWTDRPSQGLFDEYWPQGGRRPGETPPVPSTLDWDLWLGAGVATALSPGLPSVQMAGAGGISARAPLGDIGCPRVRPRLPGPETRSAHECGSLFNPG